jgi:hypothetical protein
MSKLVIAQVTAMKSGDRACPSTKHAGAEGTVDNTTTEEDSHIGKC